MVRADGDGWVVCERGHRHWGRFGAAGLLLRHDRWVLLQHRAEWSHHGGTWGLPGGARDSAETVVRAALREAHEEAGLAASAIRVVGVRHDEHGGWRYSTVVSTTVGDRPAPGEVALGGESIAVAWLDVDEVALLPLHPGFAASWPFVRQLPTGLRVVVDAANVVGSRPDGRWRDRAAATARLRDKLGALAASGLRGADLPGTVQDGWDEVFPPVQLVVEGAARAVSREPAPEAVEVVAATGSGDDVVARLAAADGPGERVLVVTADRALAHRAGAAGAAVTGPRWLLELLDRLPPDAAAR